MISLSCHCCSEKLQNLHKKSVMNPFIFKHFSVTCHILSEYAELFSLHSPFKNDKVKCKIIQL